MTTAEKAARRVYSTEELHRLRGSSSAPKLHEWIEKHDGEDAELVKEPDWDFHRRWVEKVIEDSPSPRKRKRDVYDEPLLTEWAPSTGHVIRGAKSFAARSLRSRAPLGNVRFSSGISHDENVAISANGSKETLPAPTIVTSNQPVLGEIPNNSLYQAVPWRLRRSPTPSIRRGKIESLIQNHGSPTHIRVTAGGRIVPSEQSPLCHPRFGYSAIKTNGGLVKVAPNHIGKQQWTDATQDGFIAQDTEGRLCQIINGTIVPLTEEDGVMRLYMPAPNLNITQAQGPPPATVNPANGHFNQNNFDRNFDRNLDMPAPGLTQATANAPQQPTVATQKNALDLEYTKLDRELLELNRSDARYGKKMDKEAQDAIVAKRRELVITMDSIRKAIKSLKELPQDAHVPTSPKAMRARGSTSPQGNRLPPFLQRFRQNHSISAPPMHMPGQNFGHPFFGPVPPPQQPDRSFAYPVMTHPDPAMVAPPFQMPPPSMFMQPPPFDGPVGVPFPPCQEPVNKSLPAMPPPTKKVEAVDANEKRDIPQDDGSHSSADIKSMSPRPSHALPIKDPETKKITNSKFVLNPMSPVYKPGTGFRQQTTTNNSTASAKAIAERAPTPLMFHSSKTQPRSPANTNHSVSPTKRTIVDGSSISSIKTADFFPRNTREYSMRKHEYPLPLDGSEEKEGHTRDSNATTLDDSDGPLTPKRESHNTNWNPDIPDAAFVKFASPQVGSYAAPTVPPGTPVNPSNEKHTRQPLLNMEGAKWNRRNPAPEAGQLPDRSAHNISPKSKRQTWHFIEEHPSCYGSDEITSTDRSHDAVDEAQKSTIDFTQKSRSWIEGYQAGLHRRPVADDRMGEFLDGYCSGLLKSQPITAVSTGLSDGSPYKPHARRASDGHAQTSSSAAPTSIQSKDRDFAKRPPFETSMQSFDTLKQAVIAPQNENALLTPAVDGPHVNETALHLGAWQKRQRSKVASTDTSSASYPFPQSKSLAERQVNQSEHSTARASTQGSEAPLLEKASPPGKTAPSAPTPRIASGPPPPGTRISSITSIDSTLYRPWPTTGASRALSPFDWKSSSSIGHAASLATGHMAHAQFDGTSSARGTEATSEDGAGLLTRASGSLGNEADARAPSAAAPTVHRSAFREASLDGSSPAVSPTPMSPALSPVTSPRLSPLKASKKSKGSPGSSPAKSTSPAKAKFEHIASRVGIKVSAEKHDGVGAPVSPPGGKKRWRDVWRGGAKKEEFAEGA